MSSTDDRIVRMQFDNKQFMKGAADTQKSLSDLNKATAEAGSSKGLLDLNSQMSTVSATASKMAIVTTTALATIANKITNVGLSMAKSMTLDPIKQGFLEYEALLTKQNVIMNATGKSAKEVKSYLNQLNHYSDQTIYSFSDMADSITKFTNAGVKLPTAVTSIKGIANAAAYSGASTQEASRAMYAFSQSMQTGYIMLNDWMQIENANMGTIQFKDTLLQAGEAAGTLTKKGKGYITESGKFVSATEGWRDGLKEQWATTEVLNSALGKYADTQTKLGKKAFKSATEVRTFTAFMDTLKESLGSGWASIFTSLIGNLDQATSFWTKLSGAVSSSVGKFFKFISVALKTWRAMGGFQKTIQGFKNILAPFTALLTAVGDAWDQAFPGSDRGAGKALYGLSAGFEAVTRPLAWLAEGIPAITPVLATLFKVIAKGGAAIGDVVGFITDFVSATLELSELKAPETGGFLGFVKKIGKAVGKAIDQIDKLLEKGGSLGSIFSSVKIDLPGLPSFGGAEEGSGKAADAAEGATSRMSSALDTLRSIAAKMGEAFSNLWDTVVGLFENTTPDDFVRAFNSAIFATMGIEAARLFHHIGGAFKAFSKIGDGVASVLDGTGAALKSFQTAARAKLILNMAIAIGVLAASLWLLSKIPIKRLAPALASMGALFLMMNMAMKGFGSTLKSTDGMAKGVNMVALGASIMLLAGAMLMFALAMLVMNKVDWTSVGKGLTTLGASLAMVNHMSKLAEGSFKNILAGAAAIVAVSAALLLMAGALILFDLVKWKSIGKAGAALAGVTLAIGLLALIPYEGIAKVGAALLGASAGMVAIAGALIMFGIVKWESIGKAAVVLTLLTISLALLMAEGGPVTVASMLGLAAAMVGLAVACLIFNKVDWESIGKATVVLTVLLLALAVGAVIMTVFLYAIAPVTPVLIALGIGMALLGVGLLAFATAMAIAASVATVGVAAFAALGTGAAVAIGVFLQTLALQAPVMKESILKILQAIIDTVVEAVPMIIQGFKDLWAAIKNEMSKEDKKKSFGQLAGEWLDRLIEVARDYIPKLQRLGVDLLLSFAQALVDRSDEFTDVGTEFIVKLIQGLGSRSAAITSAAVDLVIKLAKGFADNGIKLANAGVDMVAQFLHDLADAIRNGGDKIGSGITDVISAFFDVGAQMIQGLINGISSVDIQGVIEDLAGKLPGWARKMLKIESPSKVFADIGKFIVMGLTKGIQDNAVMAITAVASMVQGAIAVSDEYISKYIQKLDQQAIEARARAQGLAQAAQKATQSAKKTKDKGDDKAAKGIGREAKRADKAADKQEKEAKDARAKAAKEKQWADASEARRAEIRSAEAQAQLAAAKAAERDAEAARVQSIALRKQAKSAGSEVERKKLLKEADRMRKQAKEAAERANKLIEKAGDSASDSFRWQKEAGQKAADAFQDQFEEEAKAAAEADSFDQLTDAKKAEVRRKQAAQLQEQADKHLAEAKVKAYTDLQAANKLAQQAMAEAEQARALLDEAASYSGTPIAGQVVDLQQSDAAALAYNDYADTYDAAYAAASGASTIEFNQYNTSPESLSDAEIYRQTNNQLTFANEKLAGAAA